MSDTPPKSPQESGPDGTPRPRRNVPLMLLLLGLVAAVVIVVGNREPKSNPASVAEVERWVTEGHVKELVIYDGNRVEGLLFDTDVARDAVGTDELRFSVANTGTGESNQLSEDRLMNWNKQLELRKGTFEQRTSNNGFLNAFVQFLPWLLLMIFFWWLIMRQMRNVGGSGVMQFGRSKAKMHLKEQSNITFADVAGIEEAKEEVAEIVTFLKAPQKYRRIGARIPRGVLLVGSPGCGKTLLAKAIAGEAEVPFFSVSGSDFVEMFVGVGASRVRDLFKQARENAPCIVFLDEIDAVGRRRGTGLGGGHDEREQTLNQILVEMDGFDSDTGIILVAATNRPDVLDPALLRPGRFDRSIVINLPDVKGREAILRVHTRKVKVTADLDLARVARATPGFSGAELEALINEAALMAVTDGRDEVRTLDMEEARDKIRFGRSRKSMVMTEDQKRVTAYHEAGHAIVTILQPAADPLHKVTIIPRGMALGLTMSLPERDRLGMSKKEAEARLRVCFGGRIAEDIVFHDVTSGAQNDIEQATEMARLMVTKWGMSERVGPVSYAEGEEHLFLGREVTRTVNHSEETAQVIDSEVRRLLDEAYEDAERQLRENMDGLHRVTEALMVYETLDGEEVQAVLDGADIETLRPTSPTAAPGSRTEARPHPATRDETRPKAASPPRDSRTNHALPEHTPPNRIVRHSPSGEAYSEDAVSDAPAPAPCPAIWGIVNVTPDSFSDGGLHATTDAAVAHALTLLEEGADVLDLGGESTRPGAEPQTPASEWARVGPVLDRLCPQVPRQRLSIDTRHSETARRALAMGVGIVNDVSAGSDPAMFGVVAEAEAELVLMHMQGAPRTMQKAPHYDHVVAEVAQMLEARLTAAQAAGIPEARLIADPGIGFGKTLAHNLSLLRGLEALQARLPGVRWLLGASRKRFIGALTGHEDPRHRVAGSLACVARAFHAGLAAVRVHDVQASRDLLEVLRAISR